MLSLQTYSRGGYADSMPCPLRKLRQLLLWRLLPMPELKTGSRSNLYPFGFGFKIKFI